MVSHEQKLYAILSCTLMVVSLSEIARADAEGPAPHASTVYPGADGRLVYIPDERGEEGLVLAR